MRMLTSLKDGRQLCLFENRDAATQLNDWLWCQSFDRQESTLHSLAPYAQRASPGLMRSLIELYSQPGEIVLDPFMGSGTVAFEAAASDRVAWGSDVSPYACTIGRGKLAAPRSERAAMSQSVALLAEIDRVTTGLNLPMNSPVSLPVNLPVNSPEIPAWVQDFFHPETLQELVAAFKILQQHPNDFLAACLLGILHHVLPGFLSYPTSAEAPYLRRVTYAPDRFPHLYTYRDLRSRLLSKVKRSYRKHRLPATWEQRQHHLWQGRCAELPLADASVDAIISRPPQADGFESVRNHRLRLWFLGVSDWQAIDAEVIPSGKNYPVQMSACLQEMARVLKRDRCCALVVSDVSQHGKTRGIAGVLANVAVQTEQWQIETLYDASPNLPPGRSSCKAVKFDQILVLRRR